MDKIICAIALAVAAGVVYIFNSYESNEEQTSERARAHTYDYEYEGRTFGHNQRVEKCRICRQDIDFSCQKFFSCNHRLHRKCMRLFRDVYGSTANCPDCGRGKQIFQNEDAPTNRASHSRPEQGVEKCSICQEAIDNTSGQAFFSCTHRLHFNCMRQFREHFGREKNCPVCKVGKQTSIMGNSSKKHHQMEPGPTARTTFGSTMQPQTYQGNQVNQGPRPQQQPIPPRAMQATATTLTSSGPTVRNAFGSTMQPQTYQGNQPNQSPRPQQQPIPPRAMQATATTLANSGPTARVTFGPTMQPQTYQGNQANQGPRPQQQLIHPRAMQATATTLTNSRPTARVTFGPTMQPQTYQGNQPNQGPRPRLPPNAPRAMQPTQNATNSEQKTTPCPHPTLQIPNQPPQQSTLNRPTQSGQTGRTALGSTTQPQTIQGNQQPVSTASAQSIGQQLNSLSLSTVPTNSSNRQNFNGNGGNNNPAQIPAESNRKRNRNRRRNRRRKLSQSDGPTVSQNETGASTNEQGFNAPETAAQRNQNGNQRPFRGRNAQYNGPNANQHRSDTSLNEPETAAQRNQNGNQRPFRGRNAQYNGPNANQHRSYNSLNEPETAAQRNQNGNQRPFRGRNAQYNGPNANQHRPYNSLNEPETAAQRNRNQRQKRIENAKSKTGNEKETGAAKMEPEDCAICLEEMVADYSTFSNCGHKFHVHCVISNVTNPNTPQEGRLLCPLCRRKVIASS